MKRSCFSSETSILLVLTAAAVFMFSLSGCGGGGGGGGSGTGGLTAGTGGISLVSITFPEYTDLTGATKVPPKSAPLSQQVVLTFSGKVQGGVSSGSIRITADPGLDYLGPNVALDKVKNVLVAKGTYEVLDNVVVFTPFIPLGPIDLTPNAQAAHVPGLLPGYTYRVFVPVGTGGAIENLAGVDHTVTNPVEFLTISPDLPSLYFSNQKAAPPRVLWMDPPDGSQGVPANTFSGAPLAIELGFDEPLDFSEENLEGEDRSGNGVADQHLFLEYAERVLYGAVDRGASRPGFIGRLDMKTNAFEFVGYTNYEEINVGLNSVVMTEAFEMIGCSGTALYDVGYESGSGTPPSVSMTNQRALNGVEEVRGLVRTREGSYFGVDAGAHELVKIDAATGDVEAIGELGAGLGEFVSLAAGRDNELYGLRVYNGGSPSAVSSIERIDRSTGASEVLVSGLAGDFTSFVFFRDGVLRLFDSWSLRWVSLDLATGSVLEYGQPVVDPALPPGSRFAFDLKRYELGTEVALLSNVYHGAEVRVAPSGILPFGRWVDVMVRFTLRNVSGGSFHGMEGRDPLGAESVGRLLTYDPGSQPLDDRLLELFLDNANEETHHEFANARAIWNVQDKNPSPPYYEHLLAGLGLAGGGELGDFRPLGASSKIILDTNYQTLPLFDGSTPDITEPLAVLNGEFHFHDIIIPQGVTVMAQGSNPLVFTATGRVEIGGTIDVSGKAGTTDVTFNSAFIPTPGGIGGPGGGRGGMGQPPIPEDFTSLTQLQSVPRGERGWGPGNQYQVGGQGGESAADGPDVPWGGSKQDQYSRGSGGGGGSYAVPGHDGYPGKGRYGVDENGEFYLREPWDYWDGCYEWDGTGNWKPGDPLTPKINEFFASEDHTHPHPGKAGEAVFTDKDPENDFIGENGELKELLGGQGGGGGGSRLDSMNPETKNQAALKNPPVAPSAFDSKGGGGGGGGGVIAIHALGEIRLKDRGTILARGGEGGGGEVIGHSQFGGGAGGGAGGTIILNSSTGVFIEHTNGDKNYGKLDVSGGWGDDAREGVQVSWTQTEDECAILENTGKLAHAQFCTWSKGDGGCGSYGLIQLMVPDPTDPACLDYIDPSVEASLCVIEYEPNYDKTKGFDGFAYYNFTVEGLGPGGSKPFIQHFPTTTACLVEPEKTLSTINPQTYAISKWLDTGRVIARPSIGGKKVPVFMDFEGIKNEEGWGVVTTQNGYVVNSHIPDLNDIEVDAPDLGLPDYIPDNNQVSIQFQGTDALIPGSKVPNEDPGVMTDWTWDLASLSGKQFFRFRVKLDVAKDAQVKTNSTKPQVNKVRIRFQY